ncbi:MAG TPA: phosphatase PAP2 family protein [Kineosporiaceae bacterium]|nr:phosphatase PAP2 family protein [Kineosporiaceae bacterium]
MRERSTIDRRLFLRHAALVSAGLVAGPAALNVLASSPAAATAVEDASALAASGTSGSAFGAFVDEYQSNIVANLTPETNAAVRILSGMQLLWKTGPTWDTGLPLASDVLRANVRYVAAATTRRTEAQAKRAFVCDRQHQSYAATSGLGALTDLYRAGAQAVTNITTAPDGTPPTTVSDTLPAGAPAGSAIGAGSTTSALGAVVQLVNTVRGPFASSNPSKYAFQYPRPWRLSDASVVEDTGAVDALGYPVYESDVVVVEQLLRQRGTSATDDGGFVSGHTNAFYLACLALAYAIPERFQELVACASDLSETRIIAGMHSPADVMGGRILATALTAATLSDPQNAVLKAAARKQAAEYFQAQTGTTADTLYAYAHSAPLEADPYADREVNRRAITPRLTYRLPFRSRALEMTVPKGAEVLLETRLPYLDAEQRREVLRTTALPAGHALLDGPEQWGRLNLFVAADGYGEFAQQVRVTMDAAAGGFNAADTWRNDIDGAGGLIKQGSGALTLTGANRYTGGTSLTAGTLTAASSEALGAGDVQISGGTLRLDSARAVRICGRYEQTSAALSLVARRDGGSALTIAGAATLGHDSVLEIEVPSGKVPPVVLVLQAQRLYGKFASIRVQGYKAVPRYTKTSVSIELISR